jgi:hypothetical protein
MDSRRHQRFPFHTAATISWTIAGGRTSCVGNCFDASTHGLSAEAPQFIPVGTKTTIHLDGFDEGIEAKVRDCRKFHFWYRIGFQLIAALPLAVREQLIVSRTASESNARRSAGLQSAPARSPLRP